MAEHQPAPEGTIAIARRLVRGRDRGTLATTMPGGMPYGSIALTALDGTGCPVFLFSGLAQHTKNLAEDGRGCLLLDGTHGLDAAMTGARVALMGEIAVVDDAVAFQRYCRRHPESAAFRDLPDFQMYRLVPSAVHLIAGFGRARWIEPERVIGPATSAALLAAEADIIEHMNADHGDAVLAYAHGLLGLDGEDWVMTGIDRDGMDLRQGGAVARLGFDQPVESADAARKYLIQLVKAARQTPPPASGGRGEGGTSR